MLLSNRTTGLTEGSLVVLQQVGFIEQQNYIVNPTPSKLNQF